MIAQISFGGDPLSFNNTDLSDENLRPYYFDAIDLNYWEQEAEREIQMGLPPRFGVPRPAPYGLENTGRWSTLSNGDRVWQLKLESKGALSLNLIYKDFYIPEGGRFYVYGFNNRKVLGSFTSYNNKEDGIFTTGLIYDDEVVLEYYEPAAVKGKGRILIDQVIHGFKYIQISNGRGFNDSGSCNRNVNCPEGDPWQEVKKSVVLLLVNGFRFCTGYLMNNTAQDCRPLVMTANHCSSPYDAVNNPNANNWTFMWNYESPNCTNIDGPTNQTTVGATMISNPGNTGAVFRADFALFELTEDPKDAGYDIYYSGFDAIDIAPSSVVAIHHPSGDIKKISYENDPTTFTEYFDVNGEPTHIRVADWDTGTTEPGSSGSPIYDQGTQRNVGILSGGRAACGNNLPDWYGAIAHAWTNNNAANPSRRLDEHLDPVGNGTNLFVDGSSDPCGSANPSCDDGIQNGDETGVDCGGPDCPACPTCDDGIQNGDETGIDCGGPDCPACPTCDDGIQNGDETGVDCGGTDCLPCCELEIIEILIEQTTCGQ
ncbi:MAG: trypsin-like peptidase domain-containing protein, partial [Bacteroidota bacterium]